MTTTGAAPLRLRAFDLEDLGVVSSMVQDALVPGRDMKYLAQEHSFMLALNRFQWESAGDTPPYSRSHAGLRTFSGNAAIRLTVEKLAIGLTDLGTPWPTQWKPGHDPDAKAD